MVVNLGLMPDVCRELRLSPNVSMALIAAFLAQAEVRLGIQLSVNCLCNANALLDNLPHDGLRSLVQILMRRLVLVLFDDASCFHELTREMNASRPEETISLLKPWINQLEAAEMIADREYPRALDHLWSGRAELLPQEILLSPSVVIRSPFCDHVLLEGLICFKIGDFNATLERFQQILLSASLSEPSNAILQAVTLAIHLTNPTDISARIMSCLPQNVPLGPDLRFMFYWLVYDLQHTAHGLHGRPEWHGWWKLLDELPTNRCSLFLKEIVSTKRWMVLQRTMPSAIRQKCLAKIRSSFDPSAWLGTMLRM